MGEVIALVSTGTGKTVTAVLDAKALGKRTLFIGHTEEIEWIKEYCDRKLKEYFGE